MPFFFRLLSFTTLENKGNFLLIIIERNLEPKPVFRPQICVFFINI